MHLECLIIPLNSNSNACNATSFGIGCTSVVGRYMPFSVTYLLLRFQKLTLKLELYIWHLIHMNYIIWECLIQLQKTEPRKSRLLDH